MSSAPSQPTPERATPNGSLEKAARDFSSESPRHRPFPAMRLDRYDNSDFDRGAGRFKESLWILCKCLFFLNPFPWPSSLRAALLRLFGAKLGVGFVIRSGVNITFPWRFIAGDHVWLGDDVLILSLAPVTLASHICISPRAFLCTGSHDWREETFDLQTRAIIVEDSVWISSQAFIGPGVRIGENSLVCAGTILTKTIPNNSIAKGNPAVVAAKDPSR